MSCLNYSIYDTKKLAGATYSVTAGADIKDPAGTVVYKKGEAVANLKTDANGEAVLNNLTLGTYVIMETGAPKNYVNKGESKNVTLSEGSNSADAVVGTATFTNDRQKVEVTALKQDKLTSTVIAGAQYGLYADGDMQRKERNLVPEIRIKTTILEVLQSGFCRKYGETTKKPFRGFGFQVCVWDSSAAVLQSSRHW